MGMGMGVVVVMGPIACAGEEDGKRGDGIANKARGEKVRKRGVVFGAVVVVVVAAGPTELLVFFFRSGEMGVVVRLTVSIMLASGSGNAESGNAGSSMSSLLFDGAVQYGEPSSGL